MTMGPYYGAMPLGGYITKWLCVFTEHIHGQVAMWLHGYGAMQLHDPGGGVLQISSDRDD